MIQQELLEAKLNGLDAVRKFVNTYDHNEEFKWGLMPVSDQTADKLLKGEFETFEELINSEENQIEFNNQNAELLYRVLENKNRNIPFYVIETIFINE
jgi:hypothetical protein